MQAKQEAALRVDAEQEDNSKNKRKVRQQKRTVEVVLNTDIRISVSFKGHRKRKRLKMVLGAGSTDYLIDLWISTAMNHPDGKLVGMDEIDIALEAGWEGDAKEFVAALVRCGFLDECESGYCLHDWEDHQLYAVHAEERKERARNAAAKRWGNRKNANSIPEAMLKDADSMPEAMPLPTPSPTPSPSPTPTPLVRGGAGGDSYQMHPEWKPSQHFNVLAETSGLSLSDEDIERAKQEFIPYWLTKNRARTTGEWDLAFVKSIKSGFATTTRPRNGSSKKTARQQYMEDVGNLLEAIDETTNNGCPTRLGQAAEPLPGVRPQHHIPRKIGV